MAAEVTTRMRKIHAPCARRVGKPDQGYSDRVAHPRREFMVTPGELTTSWSTRVERLQPNKIYLSFALSFRFPVSSERASPAAQLARRNLSWSACTSLNSTAQLTNPAITSVLAHHGTPAA